METIKDLLIVFGRIITIFPLMLFIALYMGKRSIGELPVFDFLVILTLGAVVGADIADPKIHHLPTGAAIIAIGLFQKVVSKLAIKYRKFGHIITFEPTIVIQDGQFIVSNLKNIRYSIDNILQMLREKEVFDIKDISVGIIEANGRISILKKPEKSTITAEDINLDKKVSSISYPIIVDSIVYTSVLNKLNLSNAWLDNQLKNLNIKDKNDIFFASVNDKKELHVSLKGYMKDKENISPIYF